MQTINATTVAKWVTLGGSAPDPRRLLLPAEEEEAACLSALAEADLGNNLAPQELALHPLQPDMV